MKTSVAMCTYNGAKYIQEQLNSILQQTKSVDEIIICDDCSNDETIPIIRNIAHNTTIPIKLCENKENIGARRNFENAISYCKGDIIFLSDQDDVWRKDKVETILQWFEENCDKDVVFTNANLIDGENLMFSKQSLWDTFGFTSQTQDNIQKGFGIETLCENNFATGATMAFRKDAVNVADMAMLCQKQMWHDEFIMFQALVKGRLGWIDYPLINYRIHSGQTAGGAHTYFKRNILKPNPQISRYMSCYVDKSTKERIAFISERFFLRKKIIIWPFYILNLLNKYRCVYGSNWKQFIMSDVYECLIYPFMVIYRRLKKLL